MSSSAYRNVSFLEHRFPVARWSVLALPVVGLTPTVLAQAKVVLGSCVLKSINVRVSSQLDGVSNLEGSSASSFIELDQYHQQQRPYR